MKEKTSKVVMRKSLLTALIATSLLILSVGVPSASTGIGK